MHIFKYNLDHSSNVLNFTNDLYIYLNTIFDDDDIITSYTNEYVEYFNKFYNIVNNFDNDETDIYYKYEYEYEIIYKNKKLSLFLNKVTLISNHIVNNPSNKVKKTDYDNIISLLDYNYIIDINFNPYFIINIYRVNEYIQHNDFYDGKIIILKNTNLNTKFELDFDSNMIYYINDYDNEPHTFKICNNKLIIYDGPVYDILYDIQHENIIKLDEIIYEIHTDSTVKIKDFLNTI